jgi:hypothetical protein
VQQHKSHECPRTRSMSGLGARERRKKEKEHGDERSLLLLRVDVMKLEQDDDIIQNGESL